MDHNCSECLLGEILIELREMNAKLDALQSLAPIATKLTNGPLGKLFGAK